MIEFTFDKINGILVIKPDEALDVIDFDLISQNVDPYIENRGSLKGIVIYAENFPGWTDFSALISHLKFVKDHHQKVAKVALVSDAGVLSIMPSLVEHFVSAELKHFDYTRYDLAIKWINSEI